MRRRLASIVLLGTTGLPAQRLATHADSAASVFAAKHWRRINSLAGFPPSVRKQLGFIANPWEDAALGCIPQPGIPTKQLCFGGQSGQQIFVYYIQGMGIVSSDRVTLFECKPSGEASKVAEWQVRFGNANTIAALMDLAKKGQLEPYPAPRQTAATSR